MADPTRTNTASGTSAVATTTATFGFTATSGRLLVLIAQADDYFTGAPSGYTQVIAPIGSGESAWFGLGAWYKVAVGSETSAAYTIGSATASAWAILEFDNVDTGTPLDSATPIKAWASGTADTVTTGSFTPTSGGRRFTLAVTGISSTNDFATGMSGWTNGFSEVADVRTAAANPPPQQQLAAAVLAADGGSAQTTTVTVDTGSGVSYGHIVAAFNVAGSGPVAYTQTPTDVAGLLDAVDANRTTAPGDVSWSNIITIG